MSKIRLNNAITLTYEQLPRELPLPQFSLNVKVHRMSTGASGSGFEVVEKLGGYYEDIQFTAVLLTPTTMTALETLATNQTVFVLALLTEANVAVGSYNVIMTNFSPFLKERVEYEDDAPAVYGADMTFKVINKV